MDFMQKKLICFGSGSYFQIMYHDRKQKDNSFRVEAVIDNNSDKIGKEIEICGAIVPILSLKMVMDTYEAAEIEILITTAFYGDVLKQLREHSFFDNVEIKSYHEIKRRETPPYRKLETLYDEPRIPKIIHYCWFGGKEMPAHLQREVDNWHKLCPDYEFICWNETNYDIYKNAYTKYMCENKRWAYLSDYVRLDVVYEHGGIYMDTDVELLHSLDVLRCNDAFFGTEISGGINDGSGFGAIKNHFFIQELKQIYELGNVKNPLFNTTNLGKEISTFHRHGYINNGQYQVIDGVTIYPYHVLAPVIKETGECMNTEATVGIHHFEGSWC